MAGKTDTQRPEGPEVTLEDVERVLAVGRLLLSVLTPEEVEQLREELYGERSTEQRDVGQTENR